MKSEERKIDNLGINLDKLVKDSDKKLENYKTILKQKKVYIEEDPEDVSIYPRIIKKKEHEEIRIMCRDLTEAAFSRFENYLNGTVEIPISKINDFLSKMQTNETLFSGNARYDFLKEGCEYKLVEMNFVNVGALIESTESAAAIMQLFPELKEKFYYESPLMHVKKRMDERNAKRIVLLTRDDYSKQLSDSSDRPYIRDSLSPLEVIIVPEREYKEIEFNKGKKTKYLGKPVDAFYLKHLDGTNGDDDSLFKNESFCREMLQSKSFLFDSLLTMLLEDKDLRFLSKTNSKVDKYLPKIIDLEEGRNLKDCSEYVLKLKDTHCGKGVIISPKSLPEGNAILQQRIHTNKFPVRTILGKEGNGTYDTGVYVSYCYDFNKREIKQCEVAGYLTRYSLNKDIVNLSQGGGLIPTLIEK
ncbi:MAG: hypothetical protein WC781_04805 [Candidatus Pacearchaeota archaeon]|jgi:hypothetical protein